MPETLNSGRAVIPYLRRKCTCTGDIGNTIQEELDLKRIEEIYFTLQIYQMIEPITAIYIL